MRKVIVISMITLDGVMQAPGGPEEDTSGGFKYGGWIVPYADEYGGQVLNEQLGHPFDLLLGRKTYDIWKQYWPQHKDGVIGAAFDRATKYVASTTLTEPDWEKTVILKDNVVDEIKRYGAIPAAFTLEDSSHSPSGVIFANFKRDGEVKTGSF